MGWDYENTGNASSVELTRRSQDNTLDGLGLVDRIQQSLRALDSRLNALLHAVRDLFGNEKGRGDMENNVASLHRIEEGAIVEEVGFEQAELAGVLCLERQEGSNLVLILEAANCCVHRMAALEEQLDKVQADEAAAAGYERDKHCKLRSTVLRSGRSCQRCHGLVGCRSFDGGVSTGRAGMVSCQSIPNRETSVFGSAVVKCFSACGWRPHVGSSFRSHGSHFIVNRIPVQVVILATSTRSCLELAFNPKL